jgi:hypothetical protein
MNFEEDVSEDESFEYDCDDGFEDEEETFVLEEEQREFELQNTCANLYMAMKDYTMNLYLPICENLTPHKLYEFTQKLISGKNN